MRYLFFVLISVSILIPSLATAQKTKKTSSEEDVAVAFYKTGGVQPNLKEWIEKSEVYRETPLARREAMMQKELQRLGNKYTNYDLKDDFIIVQTRAKINAAETFDTIDEVNKYTLNIKFAKDPEAFFFPYTYQENNFAVMPFGLKDMMNSELTELEYQGIQSLGYSVNRLYTFVIAMRPREAVTEAPVEFGDTYQWVLKTDIITAELWKPNGALIWEYTSPGYISPEAKAINELYELKDENLPIGGTVKPLKME